jgi:hypothetical protein
VKPGDRIQINMFSGEILDAIVSAVLPMTPGMMIRAKTGEPGRYREREAVFAVGSSGHRKQKEVILFQNFLVN